MNLSWKRILQTYMNLPFYGYRRIAEELQRQVHNASPKLVYRLMQELGIKAIYPKRNLSIPNKQHKKYPYLLRGLNIDHLNQVWASDITYIRLKRGVIYLVAIIDVFSRKVLSWKLSNTLDRSFCIEALNGYENMPECRWAVESYFKFFNQDRIHQALDYMTPDEIYYADQELSKAI